MFAKELIRKPGKRVLLYANWAIGWQDGLTGKPSRFPLDEAYQNGHLQGSQWAIRASGSVEDTIVIEGKAQCT